MSNRTIDVKPPETVAGGTWGYVGGAADYTNLTSSDADTTTADSGNDAGQLLGTNPGTDMPRVYVVNTYKFGARHRGSGGTQAKYKLGVYGPGTGSALGAQKDSIATYANVLDTFATDGDGNAWTQYALDNNIGILRKDSTVADSNWKVTYAWYDVTYGEADCQWAMNVAQWIPFLMGVASHGLLLREIADALWNHQPKKRIMDYPSCKDDLIRIKEAFLRRPIYGFLA